MSVLRKGVGGFSLTAFWGCMPLLFVVLVVFVATGCSGRRHKSRPSGSLTITTTTLPDATEGSAYSYTVQATGGNSANYTWSISGQPLWLAIDATTGELSGTPPAGSAGTYTFTVTVDDGQQTASKQFDLLVRSGGSTTLRADFEATPTQGSAPLTVAFTDKSTGNPTSWEWDFDNDGTVDSTQQSPTYIYNNPGWYTVKLTVSDGTDTDTCVKEMYILVADNIWYVNGNGGNDANGGTGWNDAFATIGKALDVAGDYDLVLVADATYNETYLDFTGKKIYLKGTDHNSSGAQPVIDCQSSGKAFYFGSGETGDCVVDNFTIKNGSADYGGAIYCLNSGPTITDCVFSGNSVTNKGGAIYCYQDSSPTLTNCIFIGNSAISAGGAVFCLTNSSPTVSNCVFSGNSTTGNGGAIFWWNSSGSAVTNCTFSANSAGGSGGAIFCLSSSPTATNCTFSANNADEFGGAIYCWGVSSRVTLNNCILWNNSAGNAGDEIYVYDSTSSCTLNYCCVANTGYGGITSNITENNCIHSDPKFACAEVGVLRLKHDSPCIDAGDNSLVPTGVTTDIMGCQRIVGSAVDIGAYEVQGIIYVDRVGGDDANSGADWNNALKTIGAGLNAAGDGWIVVVADATYNETNLNFNGKRVYLEGVDYHSAGQRPVIDCQNGGRAFSFSSGETKDSIIDNFRIENGNAASGGAIYCSWSSPTITNCTFGGNRASDVGGAIFCSSSSPSITNCIFSGNSAVGSYCRGGAIYCYSSEPTIINCIFSGNSADYNGGAIFCDSSNPTVTNCTFSSNNAAYYGGAIYCVFSSSPTLNNSILWGNSAGSGGNEIHISDTGSSCTLNCCCVDNTGYSGWAGNITENNCIHQEPQFVNAANGDYHLKDTSPCIDAGDNTLVPSGVDKDLDGKPRIVNATVDIGAYEKQ